MFCTNCGREVPEDKAYCPSCGHYVGGAAGQTGGPQTGYTGEHMTPNDWNQAKYQAMFVDSEEKYLGELGDGYFKGTLSSPFGVAKKCNAVVTDKRVYLQGKMLDASQGRVNAFSWVKTVDVKDITGTGFVASNPIGLLIATVLWFVVAFVYYFVIGVNLMISLSLWIISFVMLFSYILRRKAFFVIEYEGGRIQFDAIAVGIERVRAFQHLLIRAKDAAQK